MKRLDIIVRVVLIPLDAIAAWGGLLAAYILRTNYQSFLQFSFGQGTIPPLPEFALFAAYSAGALVLIFSLHGLYTIRSPRRYLHEIPTILLAGTMWLLAIITWFFVTRELFFSRFVLVAGAIASLLAVLVARGVVRLIWRYFVVSGRYRRRVLLIGDSPLARRLVSGLSTSPLYEFVGKIDTPGSTQSFAPIPRMGSIADSQTVIAATQPTDVILVTHDIPQSQLDDILLYCQERGIVFFFLPEFYELHRSRFATVTVLGMPLIEFKQTPLEGWGRVWKRTTDIIGAAIGIIALLIPGIIIGMCIKADSPGPILVRLRRVNQGSEFFMYKFRSMIDNADQLKSQLLAQNERSGPLFKMKNDPRITRLGRILRATRIDELPQLLNVFKGEMSLVGPRPHEPEEVSRYQKHHRRVLAIKPGMTGLAQVSGASDLDFEEEVRLDTYYIEQWSIWLDLVVLVRTIGIVVTGKGAA